MEARLIILFLPPPTPLHFVSTPARARRSRDIENGCQKFHAPVYNDLIYFLHNIFTESMYRFLKEGIRLQKNYN
jgi:hypothetical protein